MSRGGLLHAVGRPQAESIRRPLLGRAGGLGLIAFCLVAALVEKKVGAIAGSGLAWISRLLVAGFVFWIFLQ